MDPPIDQPQQPTKVVPIEEKLKTYDTIEALSVGEQKKRGKAPIQPSSPPLMRSRAAQVEVFSLGMSNSSRAPVAYHEASHSSLFINHALAPRTSFPHFSSRPHWII